MTITGSAERGATGWFSETVDLGMIQYAVYAVFN